MDNGILYKKVRVYLSNNMCYFQDTKVKKMKATSPGLWVRPVSWMDVTLWSCYVTGKKGHFWMELRSLINWLVLVKRLSWVGLTKWGEPLTEDVDPSWRDTQLEEANCHTVERATCQGLGSTTPRSWILPTARELVWLPSLRWEGSPGDTWAIQVTQPREPEAQLPQPLRLTTDNVR